MENVYYTLAIVAFALAICSFIVCIIVFFRANVADAIRFLLHKPMRNASSEKSKVARARMSGDKRGASRRGASSLGKKLRASTGPAGSGSLPAAGQTMPDNSPTTAVGDASNTITITLDLGSAAHGAPAAREVQSQDTEAPTGLLGQEQTEAPTSLLGQEGTQAPTGLLGQEDTEAPTGLLGQEQTEAPTGLLQQETSEAPTGLLGQEGSEAPTGLLNQENTEAPTGLQDISDSAPAPASTDQQVTHSSDNSTISSPEGVAQHDDTIFTFILVQSVVEVHTNEVID